MATIQKRSGKYRVLIRRKGHKPLSRTFPTKSQAERWMTRTEAQLADGHASGADMLLSEAVDRYLDELESTKPAGKSKRSTLQILRDSLGKHRLSDLSAAVITDYLRLRAASAKPATVTQYIIYLGGLLRTAKEIWNAPVDLKAFDSAAAYARRYGLAGASARRSFRVPADLLAEIKTAGANRCRLIPFPDIVDFAVASSMRLGEICSIRWQDLDDGNRTVTLQRKHPVDPASNIQTVPLLGDAWVIVQRQPRTEAPQVFPYKPESVSTAWQRVCKSLGVGHLHFHDLRHEGISQLFEQGFSVMEVALVSGHRDINMLRRYVQLRPEELHDGPILERARFLK